MARAGEPEDPWWYIPDELRIRYDQEFVSIPNAVRISAGRWPAAEALADEGKRWTFADLEREMLASVRSVLAMGVRPGDRVALWAPNSARWVIAALGILGAGAVLVPVNTRFKGQEAAYILDKSGASALFLVTDFLGNDYAGLLRSAAPGSPLLAPGRTVVLSGPAGPGQLSWEKYLAAGSTVPPGDATAAIDAVHGDTLSDIMFTSGTTGHPKGVRLTHAQSLRAHGWFAKMMDFRPGDRYLIIPPFFHTFGYKAGWMACIVHGVTVLPQATFDLEEVIRKIETERISILLGPPTVIQAVLDAQDGRDFSSLRVIMASATIVPPELLRRVRDELKPEVIHGGYGLTEATSLVTTTVAGADDFEHIATTVGRPSWDVEVRVVDNEGRDVPAGNPGEILARGYNVMDGYWEDPEKTAEVIDADGWLHTGDVGTMDAGGYVRITDRKKDMILVGGFNVYPAEVERILGQHPAVSAIAVVGVPDERLGEVPAAFVVPVAGASLAEREFLAWAAGQIANFKVPRHAFLVADLPRNASMKVLKGELRAQAGDLLRGSGPAA
jgi:acyl-CoA synthetase (AMP-forming)/AMP-acid ligase II